MIYLVDQKFQGQFGDKIKHGYFKRNGGVSHGVYGSLNCGYGSVDEKENVATNQKIVATAMDVELKSLLTLRQKHGEYCTVVKDLWPLARRPLHDSMVTNVPGIALGILTADCAPILFYGEDARGKPVIGAAHAGWRGAFEGIVGSTIKHMGKLGVQPKNIHASIGPCISHQSYEVGSDMRDVFLKRDKAYARFFVKTPIKGKYKFDLVAFIVGRLLNEGVTLITSKDIDTYFNEEDFFSFRRSTHRNSPDCGRQLSVITIK